MNLNRRVEKLENKSRLGNGVYVIDLGEGETYDQAVERYCAENDISIEDLDNRGPDSLIVLLDESGGHRINDAHIAELEHGNEPK